MTKQAPTNRISQLLSARRAYSPALSAGKSPTPQNAWDYADQLKVANPDALPWHYYDTVLFGAKQFPGQTAANPLTGFTSPLQFFNARTLGNGGLAVTNMGDTSKTDADFVCEAISIEAIGYCDTTYTGGSGSPMIDFVTTIAAFGVFELQFAGNPVWRAAVSQMPAGGGVKVHNRQTLQAAAAALENGYATNGEPTATALRYLPKPILFKNATAFVANLVLPNSTDNSQGPLHKIQNLTANAGDFTFGVRVNLVGFKGNPLLKGVSLAIK